MDLVSPLKYYNYEKHRQCPGPCPVAPGRPSLPPHHVPAQLLRCTAADPAGCGGGVRPAAGFGRAALGIIEIVSYLSNALRRGRSQRKAGINPADPPVTPTAGGLIF